MPKEQMPIKAMMQATTITIRTYVATALGFTDPMEMEDVTGVDEEEEEVVFSKIVELFIEDIAELKEDVEGKDVDEVVEGKDVDEDEEVDEVDDEEVVDDEAEVVNPHVVAKTATTNTLATIPMPMYQ
eukprot:m.171243 g.171243  ORF g.171243 m.171243 type:complete len:128 (-) comp13495_c3_seq1:303-686(-)